MESVGQAMSPHEPCIVNLTMRVWPHRSSADRSCCLYQGPVFVTDKEIRRSISNLINTMMNATVSYWEVGLYCQRL